MKKRSDLITVICFCLVIALLSVTFVLMPDISFSQQENRNLAQFPEFTADKFFSGEFAAEINGYFADQFPLRNSFVKLKSGAELLLGKGENNGVLYNYSQLAVKDFDMYTTESFGKGEETATDRIDLDVVKRQLQRVDKLANSLSVPMVTVLPPRTVDIADGIYNYDRPDGDAVFEMAGSVLSEKAGYIDTLSLLRDKYGQGEYVYYRTDHHWTTPGAYYVYCEIMASYGKADRIIPKEDFEIVWECEFAGTTAAKGNFPFFEKDILEGWHLPDDGEYTVIADGIDIGGFYSQKQIENGDEYAYFLDGTHNETVITKSGEDRETLIVIKDSFANCLIPFLAREFDIVALNYPTNEGAQNVSALVEQHQADGVLLVYNIENLVTSALLGKIK